MAGVSKRAIIAAIERGALKAQKLPGPQGQYVIDRRVFARYQEKRAAAKASA
jgi:hypothetical protein